MFCTDELHLNQSRFKDGEEIVLISRNVDEIAGKIEYYLENPQLLKEIAEAGCTRTRQLYGYEAQIAPRIKLLRDEMEKPFVYDERDFRNIKRGTLSERVLRGAKKLCPEGIKRIYRRLARGG
jgi:hypothetical protein